MRRSVLQFLLLIALAGLVMMISGCASTESENDSVRPWNAPQGWENGLGGMGFQDMQHP